MRSPEEALRRGFFPNLPVPQPQLGYGRSPEAWILFFRNVEWPLMEMFIERVGRGGYSYEWGGARHAVTFVGRPTHHGVVTSIQIWARYANPVDRSVPASPIHRPGRVCWEHGSQCGLCLWLDENTP